MLNDDVIPHDDPPVIAFVKFLAVLNDINERTHLVPYTIFYNDGINEGNAVDFRRDFMQWKEGKR